MFTFGIIGGASLLLVAFVFGVTYLVIQSIVKMMKK